MVESKSLQGIHLLYCKKGKRGFTVHILEKCKQVHLGENEANWMKKLQTFHPLWLNIRHNYQAQEVSSSGQVFSKKVSEVGTKLLREEESR
jgi:hypothetical protein